MPHIRKKSHVIWVAPNSNFFYRNKGQVKVRPRSVLPALVGKGFQISVLIPFDSSLLPKSKLASSRVSKHSIHLSQNYPVEILKLTRSENVPAVYMAKLPSLEPAIRHALYSKAALSLAAQLNKPVDIFHLFEWETSLLPLFLELEKEKGKQIFSKTKTFLNVQHVRSQGNFSPEVLNFLGVPKVLFHPDGIEFYGQISFLKAGLLFSDGVGLIETPSKLKSTTLKSVNGWGGVMEANSHKFRRWISDRAVRSYVAVYRELLSAPHTKPLLPPMMKKIHANSGDVKKFILSWGPVPPSRYSVNMMSLMIQTPNKAFTFWEWTGEKLQDYGLVLHDATVKKSWLLSRGLGEVGEYWLDVESDHLYSLEFVGFSANGERRSLMKTRQARTPRMWPSDNMNAEFIDLRSRRRFLMKDWDAWWKDKYKVKGLSSLERLKFIESIGIGGASSLRPVSK